MALLGCQWKQAQKGADAEEWRLTCQQELDVVIERAAELVPKQRGERAVANRFLLTVKQAADGTAVRKARLVAQGQTMQQGFDYDKKHATTVKQTTVRVLMAQTVFLA